jgi:hypothetical protein
MLSERILNRLIQIPGIRTLWTKVPVGSVERRVRFGAFPRPHYAYGIYYAADLAKRLGIPSISVIELGVAYGAGLLAMESISGVVANDLGVAIHVAGFDTGQGMPAPTDYRDLPHVWGEGFYAMQEEKLRARLSLTTELVIGGVADVVHRWNAPAPIGFVAFDLDYYSSTKAALSLFEASEHRPHLPRVYCYFDDIIEPARACYNEHVGELLAIREFNDAHASLKVCPIHLLRHTLPYRAPWCDAMYVLHDFHHPLYCRNITGSKEASTQSFALYQRRGGIGSG